MKTIAGISAMIGLGGSGGAAKVGMVGKMLIIGAEVAFFTGITNAIIDAFGWRKGIEEFGSNLWSNTHQTDINKQNYGEFSPGKISKTLAAYEMEKLYFPEFILNAIRRLRTNEPQQVEVKVTMDKNAKDFVKAEVQQNTQQQINSLIPPLLRAKL